MRVPALSRIDEPGVIIADELAIPVFILYVVDGVRSHDNAVILPKLDDSLRVLESVFAIGDHVVIIRKGFFQEVHKTLLASIYWSFAVFW